MRLRARSGTTRSRAVFVTILLVFSAAIGVSMSASRGNAQASSPTITKQWLDQQMPAWKPEQNVSMGFQVFDPRVSYGNIGASYNNLDVQTADLNMLISTKAGCVRMDIGYAPWLNHNQGQIDTITAMVQKVRAAGLCLIIADAASESYRNGGQLTWTQFKIAWESRVATLASLYHPDYYLVVKEPGWYVPMVSDARTNPAFSSAADWLNLTQTLAADVVAASPDTQVGVSVAADSLGSNPSLYVPYLTGLGKVSSISFLGYDIYTTTGFNATQSFLQQYGSFGKGVWIAEAWSGTGGPSIFDPSRAALDKEWILVLYYFAEHIGATEIMPFYTDIFSSYSLTNTSPTDPSQIVSLFSQRTPVFYEFQAIVTASGTSISTSSLSSSTTSTRSSSRLSSQTATGQGSSSTTTSATTFSFTSVPKASSGGQSGPGRLTIVAAGVLVLILAVVVYAMRRSRQRP